MRKSILLLIVGVALILASCAQNTKINKQEINKNVKNKSLIVYFYYRPTCPWCRMIEPYMELVKKEGVDVVFCDTTNFSECSIASKKIANESGLHGVPTAIVVKNKKIIKKFEGAYDVATIGKFLKKLGYNVTTEYRIKGLTYTVKDCVDCHFKKNLPPPSNYSCSSCCH